MKKQLCNFRVYYHRNFFYRIVLSIFVLTVIFQTDGNASMGTMTVKGIEAEIVSSSDSMKLSRTTLKTLSSQERNITINDVSGTVMVTGFSNILTSTTLNSSHNGVILVSGNTTLSLPSASGNIGIQFTIKKIDTSSSTVTISGTIDGESNPQLTEQNSYITIISNGNAWYKVGEYVATETSSADQTYISNSLGMTFRLIPAGTFVMGSPSDELGRDTDDETQYSVTISESFYIQTTEVTQGQWKDVMGNNPSHYDSCGLNCPVDKVSWEDAQTFIATLNAMGEGSYTFPTEAQWEYAARAGSNKAFANGGISDTTTDSNLDVMGWCDDSNSGSTPHAVAQKQPNAWGLYDMHGNVYEWCQDWYGTYPDISVTDPGGASSGSNRVIRGGYWGNPAENCRSANRNSESPGNSSYNIGLRLSRTLKP